MAKVNLKKYERKILVRRLRPTDFDAVVKLQETVFPGMAPWTREEFDDLIKHFPAVQLGVESEGVLAGISSGVVVPESLALAPHTFKDISLMGRQPQAPDADYLYGVDIAILPEYQGQKLARRLYEARKDRVRHLNLKGMIIGGRIPGYHQHAEEMSADEYVERVSAREIKDPVIYAQLANEFVIREVVADYLPQDKESLGYAVLMEWVNPDYVDRGDTHMPKYIVRLCVVQYQMRQIKNFDQFARQVEYFVDTASDYRCDFVLFPEILTAQLLSLVREDRPELAARALNRYTDPYLDFFTDLAIRYNVNIIGGSHLTLEDDKLYNIAYLFRRDGTIGKQYKVHVTPAEGKWWGVTAGDQVHVFDTDCGKISILVCYDIEFPELARVVVEKGANILFVPYNTDMRSGHLRVSRCALARCIENHCYVAISGATGNLPNVDAADIHYAQSGIYTPSDIPFDRDGIAAECTPNVEMVVIHDLNIDLLAQHRQFGTVRNWNDRRTDLYRVTFQDGDETLEI